MIYHQRAHVPVPRLRGGVVVTECSRCAVRRDWPGWSESCAAPMSQAPEPGSPEHATHVACASERKRRDKSRRARVLA